MGDYKDNERTFPIQHVGVKYICEHCGEGEMLFVPDNDILLTFPPMFKHRCNKCGGELSLPRQYPYIKWIPADLENNGGKELCNNASSL